MLAWGSKEEEAQSATATQWKATFKASNDLIFIPSS